MTAAISSLSGVEAYALLSPEYFTTLSDIERDTMYRTMKNSTKVWLGRDEGKIIAVWGLIPPTMLADCAYLWLYTTKYLHDYTFVVVRQSQIAIKQMLEEYPIIVGHCLINAPKSQRWLRWLGAEFSEPVNDVALPFTIRASQ